MRMLAFFILLLVSSCGYQFQNNDDQLTLSIPYVKGDNEGQLTNELIRQFAYSGAYQYVKEDGNLTLKVVILGDTSEKIGFRYDRNEFTGKLETNLQPTEDRRTITAQVSLVNAATEEIVIGPYQVSSFSDYDYTDINSIQSLSFFTPGGKRQTILNFSLGQVDSIEGAQDDAVVPLYRNLAKKIADGILRGSLSPSSP